jgi:SPP1 gp7 family putative phage head morphogenesis protein
MPDVYEQAQEFKARLLRGERAALGELLRAYRLTVERAEARIKDLTDQIEKFQGEEISSSWLYERGRLSQLKFEIQIEINRFSQVASLRVAREQRAAISQASEDAQALIAASNGDAVSVQLGTLNANAVVAMAGHASDGSSLRQLFAARGGVVAQGVADELVSGVATGASLRVIASRVRDVLGSDLARALTIGRTEILRSYRAASLETYRRAGFTQYRWLAAKDLRTCLICLALDGSIWSINQPFPAHVNCRCTFVPVINGQAMTYETAAEWFAAQSEGAKREMLGGAYGAYAQGRITLKDFVGFKQSARWGLTAYRRPLAEILTDVKE